MLSQCISIDLSENFVDFKISWDQGFSLRQPQGGHSTPQPSLLVWNSLESVPYLCRLTLVSSD
jgi:hypothetical protein